MTASLRILAALLLPLIAAVAASAHDRDFDHSVSVGLSPGWTLPTSKYFRGDNPEGHRFGPMLGGSLRWSMSPAASTRAARLWPGLRMGAGIMGLTLFRPSLTGTPAGVFIFQGADIARFSPRLALGYEWQFGAAAPWQIMDSRHPDNMVNGSPVTAILGASLLLRYSLSPAWEFSTGLDLAHYSNGNTRWPNAGTNTAGLRLAVARRFGASARQAATPAAPADDSNDEVTDDDAAGRIGLDLLAYGSWHKKCYHDPDNNPLPLPGVFGAAGINISPMYQLRRRLRLGLSLDLMWDESAIPPSYVIGDENSGNQPYYIRPPFKRQTAAGLAVAGEYVMPVFSLHLSMGYNALAGCSALRYFYQTLALRTYVTPRVWLNVGYSLRGFSHPRHLMLGIGMRIGGRGNPTLF